MGNTLIEFIPRQGAEVALVLFLSFLIGLEREEQKAISERYGFGGVRTFPLLGLLGYALSLFSEANLLLPAVGFAVVGGFLWQSYRHKLETAAQAGVTTELSALVTYTIGALVSREHYWMATTLAVLSLALLELKTALESLAKRVPGEEILTFAKFLLLSAVILPIVPNRVIGSFGFNPFKMWVVVVAVSAISYGSYLLQMWARERGGVVLGALLGGAYSSTLTTIVLAKRSREQAHPHLYSGSMLIASGVMYLRLLVLLGIFNHELLRRLEWPFLLLAAAAIAGGLAVDAPARSRRFKRRTGIAAKESAGTRRGVAIRSAVCRHVVPDASGAAQPGPRGTVRTGGPDGSHRCRSLYFEPGGILRGADAGCAGGGRDHHRRGKQ